MSPSPPDGGGDRNALVERHLPLARHLARRFRGRGVPDDDLEQVAAVALVHAVDRFEPERGLAFSTFATPTILGELKRYFRDRTWSVRVPRRIHDLHLQLERLVAERTQATGGRAPTVDELATELGVSSEEVLEAMEAGGAYRSRSLSEPVIDGSGQPRLLADDLGDDDPALAVVENRAVLEPLLAELPARERLIVHLRFDEHLSQRQIAERLGISQMHVSRLLARTLAVLRAAATD